MRTRVQPSPKPRLDRAGDGEPRSRSELLTTHEPQNEPLAQACEQGRAVARQDGIGECITLLPLVALIRHGYGGFSRIECGAKSMTRTFALVVGALAAAVLVAGLMHAVLVVAHVSQPAVTTVYGATPRRLWATTVVGLALVGVAIGGLALIRPAGPFGPASGRLGVTVALLAGLIAAVNGGLVLAFANGGPGSGNGVVGGAGALVLGLIAIALGGMALER